MDQIPWWLSFILFAVASFGLICISLIFQPCRAWWLSKWEMKKQEIVEGEITYEEYEQRKIDAAQNKIDLMKQDISNLQTRLAGLVGPRTSQKKQKIIQINSIKVKKNQE